jgi:hypothetical protein
VTWDDLLTSLRAAKPGAIEFLHFGACEIIEEGNRRGRLLALSKASRARWVSGYVKDVGWLRSMLLDLAVVAELFLPFYPETSRQRPHLPARARWFLETYGQLARALGFSGLARQLGGVDRLIPGRLRG